MRGLVFVLALLFAAATAAHAQGAIPDLKGTWSGKGKAAVLGNNPHHPGAQTPADPPRVRDIEATHIVEGPGWPARLGTLVIHRRGHQGTLHLDDRARQQVDPRRRSGRLFPDHAHLGQPHGKVLRPQWHGPDPLDRRHVLHDGTGKEVTAPQRSTVNAP